MHWTPPRHSKHNEGKKKAFVSFRKLWPLLRPVLAVVFIILILLSLPIFRVKNVLFEGNKYISDKTLERLTWQIIEQQKNIFWFKQNIFLINTDELAQALNHPRLASVQVTKEMPNSLKISVEEKNLFANYSHLGKWYEVDNEGIAIGERATPAADSIKIINSSRALPVRIGDELVSKEVLVYVQEFNDNISGINDVQVEVYDISSGSPYELLAQTKAGVVLKFGLQLSVDEQLAKLDKFAREQRATQPDWASALQYIDLRFSNSRIYYQ